MLSTATFVLPDLVESLPAGSVLRHRGEALTSVVHLDSGRVQLGVAEQGRLRRQFGTLEGPFWLDAVDALLGLPAAMDVVAETPLKLRRLSLAEFQAGYAALPREGRALLLDVARASRHQQDMAVSRLVQDAEARCADWLLAHAEQDAGGGLLVILHQRKRLIAAQLGIAPETFSRVLRQLREHGLIAGTGKVLSLLQPRALATVAGH